MEGGTVEQDSKVVVEEETMELKEEEEEGGAHRGVVESCTGSRGS